MIGKFNFHLIKKWCFLSLSPELKKIKEWPPWLFHPLSCCKARRETVEIWLGQIRGVWGSFNWQPECVSCSLTWAQAGPWAEWDEVCECQAFSSFIDLSQFYQWVENCYWIWCCSLPSSKADTSPASMGNCKKDNEWSSPSYPQCLQQPNEENWGSGRLSIFLKVKELLNSRQVLSLTTLTAVHIVFILYCMGILPFRQV